MAKLDAFHVKWRTTFALGHLYYFLGGNEEEFRFGINEFLNQPRTSHAINLNLFPSNPLHDALPPVTLLETLESPVLGCFAPGATRHKVGR
jgi:hypothetical protein